METLQALAWALFLALIIVICVVTIFLVLYGVVKVVRDDWKGPHRG